MYSCKLPINFGSNQGLQGEQWFLSVYPGLRLASSTGFCLRGDKNGVSERGRGGRGKGEGEEMEKEGAEVLHEIVHVSAEQTDHAAER